MKNNTAVAVSIARSIDGLQQAYAIRAAVFLGEQSCPYAEEYDGNDLCATHFLAHVDDHVVGTLRMRFFAGFVKLERLAVLPEWRGRGVAAQLVADALWHIQLKGYRSFQLHAQTRFVQFWKRWAKQTQRDESFVFSDHEYVIMRGELPAIAPCISSETPPMVLNRPEGAWDVPGVLDASQSRGVTINRSKSERTI